MAAGVGRPSKVEIGADLQYGPGRSAPLASPLRKLVWMVVAFAAMILFAPMTASAHEGHHAGAAISTPKSHAADHATAAGERVAAKSVGLGAKWTPPASDAPCATGCCVGMVCCAVAIVSTLPALDPPAWFTTETSPRAPPFFAGLSPSSLLEPPNSLT